AVINQELGSRSLFLYLLGMGGASIAAGLTLDALLDLFDINIVAHISASMEMVPGWIAWASLAFLGLVALNSVKKRLLD
ncbi:MAG: hypothetical protein MI867_14080, partial [Pseudomonadales bacterium]|nr:hypothetical protein [Pseudomonadales bacterium]